MMMPSPLLSAILVCRGILSFLSVTTPWTMGAPFFCIPPAIFLNESITCLPLRDVLFKVRIKQIQVASVLLVLIHLSDLVG